MTEIIMALSAAWMIFMAVLLQLNGSGVKAALFYKFVPAMLGILLLFISAKPYL